MSFLHLRSPTNREAVESTCVLVDVLLTHFGRVDALTKLHVELVDVKNEYLIVFNRLEALIDEWHEIEEAFYLVSRRRFEKCESQLGSHAFLQTNFESWRSPGKTLMITCFTFYLFLGPGPGRARAQKKKKT